MIKTMKGFKKKFKKIIHLRALQISVLILLILVVFFSILNIVNAEKINWRMKIAGVSVGRLSPQEAQEKLETATQQFLKKELSLNYKESYWQTSPERLGVEIDVPATINLASSKNNIWWQFASLWGYNLKPIWQIDEQKLENFFQENLASIHQPAQNASFVYNKEKQDFNPIPSQKGMVIDKKKFRRDLKQIINNFQEKEIQLTLIKDQPEVLENETQQAYKKAKEILARAPYKLIVNDPLKISLPEFALIKESLILLIKFQPVKDENNPKNKILGVNINEQGLKNYLTTLSSSINREPINAQLVIKENYATRFALSQKGLKLDIEKNIPKIREEILNKDLSADKAGETKIELEIIILLPKIATKDINNLGITALIGKGVSSFSGSPNSRIHNIKIGAEKFNGYLIKLSEEFSFNNILGEIGPEQGYKPELVIKKDKTIPEYGGGLCQVSTTAFRAAINTGLEITRRYPHAFPVKYYDPQGFDATIYPPWPDLRFINNTPSYVLIQTKINDFDLIFEFYGTNDGRKIEIEGPHQYDIKKDGSMKAKLFQKVYDKKSNLIIDKTFYSNYKSPDLYPIERNPLE
jgi:vancomycin resistance protein YoaR